MFNLYASLVVLALAGIQTCAGLSTGTFTWPESTVQCGTYNLTIFDGVPPWIMVFAPIGGKPIFWDITAPARYDGSKSVTADIPVQLAGGTPYIVYMQDSSGYFSGLNPTQVQITGIGPRSDCLVNVIDRSQDFTFTVSGTTTMCEDDFQISWQDTVGNGPHNFTVLPLDSSTSPWDQILEGGGTTTGASGWNVNMTTGTRFTIMMNNAYGYGTGGVGGVYQVAEGSSNSCIIAPMYTTAAWPGSLQTTTLLTAAALPTSVITSRSTRESSTISDVSGDEGVSDVSSSSRVTAPPVTVIVTSSDSAGGLSPGAMAGIGAGVGVLALGALIAGLLFWLRKRKRNQTTVNDYARPVDLHEDGNGRPPMSGVEPKVEPYPSPEMTGLSGAPQMAYNRTSLARGSSHEYGDYAPVGAAAAVGSQQQSRTSMAYSDNQMSPVGNGNSSDRYSMASHAPQTSPYFPPSGSTSGQAGPLPSKTNIARQSYQSQSQSFQGPPGALDPQSPGSVSGSSSSGRPLPGPPGFASMSESGTNDTKVDNTIPEHESHAGTQGHGSHAPVQLEPVFNIHRDAEAEPAGQTGMIDLPPMYQDVPQRRVEEGSQTASPRAAPNSS